MRNTIQLGLQKELEKLYNKNQTISRIKREFVNSKSDGGFDLYAHMVANGVEPDFGYSLLVQLVLHKRCPMATMVGILRKHVTPDKAPLPNLQSVADMILLCCEIDLCELHVLTGTLIIKHDITDEVQKDLDLYQYPLPMVVEPKQLNKNTDSAFITSSDGGGSVILRNNHHDGDVCLDHLNRMNKVKFSLNHNTATMVKNRWRNLDKPKIGEDPKDYKKRCKAFNKYDKDTMQVVSLIVSEFKENKDDNVLYLTHKYDKRGRSYCQGYHVNYQGAPWNKAVIELAEKELVI